MIGYSGIGRQWQGKMESDKGDTFGVKVAFTGGVADLVCSL